MNVTFAKDKSKKKFSLNLRDIFTEELIRRIQSYVVYFLILMIVGLGFYFVMLIENNFSLSYSGDYSAQYIPMGFHIWDYWHGYLENGVIPLFDNAVYLGVNSIASNSYYGIYSPFNILIIMFPRDWVPSMIAITSMVKIATAGMIFRAYIRYFGLKESTARICGIAYGFCGWGAFYLWFNNYQDVLVFFPLVLFGIEKVLKEKKPWMLMAGCFLLEICNYILMVPYVICAFIYAMFRWTQRIKQHTLKENLLFLAIGFAGFAGGLLMGICVFLPSYFDTINSPKLEASSYTESIKEAIKAKDYGLVFKYLFSWEYAMDQHQRILPNRVYYPIIEFFFPATTCRSLPTMELYGWDFDDIAVSLWCYTPFIMFLVPSLINSVKEKKWSHLIAFALIVVSLFTPLMYFLTMGFKNGYARWTLFIATSLIAYVAFYIDKLPNIKKLNLFIGYLFAILGITASFILTYELNVDQPEKADLVFRFVEGGFNATTYVFIIEYFYVTVAFLVILITHKKKWSHIALMCIVSAEAIVMGNLVTFGHGYDTRYNNGYEKNSELSSIVNNIQDDDSDYYRMFTNMNNAYSENNGLMNNYGGTACFHSSYNYNVGNLTLWTNIRYNKTSVSGLYRGKYQDLDTLLGIKYYVVSKDCAKYNEIENVHPGNFKANVPLNFTRAEEYDTDNFVVYRNDKLNTLGYTYDKIYTYNSEDDLDGFIETGGSKTIDNTILFSKAAVLNYKDSAEVLSSYPTLSKYTNDLYGVNIRRMIDCGNNYYRTQCFARDLSITNLELVRETEERKPKYDNASTECLHYISFFENLTPGGTVGPYDEGCTYYIYAPFTGSQKYIFYFLDEDGHVFMYDRHDDQNTDNICYMRGFYTDRRVSAIAYTGVFSDSKLTNVSLYAESGKAYKDRMAALEKYPLENVHHSNDKFTFETHFDTDRFVVTHVAFDKGWNVVRTNEDTGKEEKLKTYLGTGGLVSFVAEQGNYSYVMYYKTPLLDLANTLSIISFSGFMISLGWYSLKQKEKLNEELFLLK